jgi:hypothetical protein
MHLSARVSLMSLEQFQGFDKELIKARTRPDRPTPLEQAIGKEKIQETYDT